MGIAHFRRKPATAALLLLIATAFAVELLVGALGSAEKMRRLGAITPDLFSTGEHGRLWKGIFLHGSFAHWIANSWALLQLGGLFEEMFGSRRFLIVWFATGACASAVSSFFLKPDGLSVGASGAIFGVTGAFLFTVARSDYWKNHPVSRGLLVQLSLWGVINIAFGALTPFVDNAAHIGGFVAGLLVGLLPQRPASRLHTATRAPSPSA